jgi:hypothetical protein
MAIELSSLGTRRGFKQAIRIGSNGQVESIRVQERVSAPEVVALRNATARIGATLGIGALTDLAVDSPNVAALFIVTDANETTAAAFEPAGDALDDRAKEFKLALDPNAGSLVVRRMGFTELRR